MTIYVIKPSAEGNQYNSRIVNVYCNDTLATITTAGYLNTNAAGFVPAIGDFYFITYGTSSNLQAVFVPSITNGIVTLSASPVSQTLTSAIVNPDVSINLVAFRAVVVGQAALATGGSVILYTATAGAQYQVLNLQLNSGGTNFSGGSGDRLGQVTDGTTVYSVIPAATMQSLVNAQWGVTALPNPASAAISTLTAVSANLLFKYSDGTLDYTAGSLTISGLLRRVV